MKEIPMSLAYIRPLGGNLYFVHKLEHRVDPGYGLPGGGADPGYGLPEGGHPAHPLPPSWPGYPTTGPVWPGKPVDPGYGVGGGAVWWPVDPGYGRPVRPPRPDHELPTAPGAPDNTLPSPPPAAPGMVVVLVRTADGKWHYAMMPAATVPTPLPEPPPTAAPKG
jgi:hypothetical protein